jgi:hypothetical protein
LAEDIAELELKANDRLEPTETLPDIGLLEDLEVPAIVLFWRSSDESIARHRNPLLIAATGIIPYHNLTVDVLHALHLGVMNKWCRVAIWFVLDSGVYSAPGAAEEILHRAVLLFRHELMTWYSARQREKPGEVLTRLSDFTVKMIGTRSHPKCKTKGAETFGLSLFLLHLFQQHAARLGHEGHRLARAGQCLVDLVNLWNRAGRVPSPVEQQDSLRPCVSVGFAFLVCL